MAIETPKMKTLPTSCISTTVEGEHKSINSELWHACAGPLISLPPVGSYVCYFPQGHSEQLAASTQKAVETHIPNYPNLPSQLICQLHNVTMHADVETDEVYAQMTLQPVNSDAVLESDLGLKQTKHPTEFFWKTLTASDTSTHGGLSVPCRAAEKVFLPLDYSQKQPAQLFEARDLHDKLWKFRHTYRVTSKRHLLTTGWSVFVREKRLVAGDSVLFIRDEKSQLLLGIRRANQQQTPMQLAVLSSDCMHIGGLAAVAHVSANRSPFTVFYNPRTSPSEFVVPLAKYNKALNGPQVSVGMQFRMMFETEYSSVSSYSGTITGISDLDSVRWPNSQWRNLQVGWEESGAGDRQNRVSIWEIETGATPFSISPRFSRRKRPLQPGMMGEETDFESTAKRSLPSLREQQNIQDFQNPLSGLRLEQWRGLEQRPEMVNPAFRSEVYPNVASSAFHNFFRNDAPRELCAPQQTLQPCHKFPSVTQPQQQEHQQQPQISWQKMYAEGLSTSGVHLDVVGSGVVVPMDEKLLASPECDRKETNFESTAKRSSPCLREQDIPDSRNLLSYFGFNELSPTLSNTEFFDFCAPQQTSQPCHMLLSLTQPQQQELQHQPQISGQQMQADRQSTSGVHLDVVGSDVVGTMDKALLASRERDSESCIREYSAFLSMRFHRTPAPQMAYVQSLTLEDIPEIDAQPQVAEPVPDIGPSHSTVQPMTDAAKMVMGMQGHSSARETGMEAFLSELTALPSRARRVLDSVETRALESAAKLTSERAARESERAAWQLEREALLAEKEQLVAEKEQLVAENKQLVADKLQAAARRETDEGEFGGKMQIMLEILMETVAELKVRKEQVYKLWAALKDMRAQTRPPT